MMKMRRLVATTCFPPIVPYFLLPCAKGQPHDEQVHVEALTAAPSLTKPLEGRVDNVAHNTVNAYAKQTESEEVEHSDGAAEQSSSPANHAMVSPYTQFDFKTPITAVSPNLDNQLRELERVYYCDGAAEGGDHERMCFTSCNNINQQIAPQWFQFDEFCQRQAETDAMWNHPLLYDCREFYECIYGCAMYGKGRWRLQRAAADYRVRLIAAVQMGITEILKKCDALKCKAYCAKDSFTTCHEVQWRDYCLGEKAQLDEGQGCDVMCNDSVPRSGFAMQNGSVLLLSLLAAYSFLHLLFPADHGENNGAAGFRW
ncbi:unnamed protein product [Amoebophrya sp. A120]|nr:unnamed protein product [Amoebophrya sp. A120]|eukprot:GSA120T00002089001.1